jgi:hypothetical protein
VLIGLFDDVVVRAIGDFHAAPRMPASASPPFLALTPMTS